MEIIIDNLEDMCALMCDNRLPKEKPKKEEPEEDDPEEKTVPPSAMTPAGAN